MPKFSISNRNKYFLLIPFLYFYFSRGEWPRGFLVNVITSWVPGIILVAFQAQMNPIEAARYFFLGYILFICIYEIGYLANDSYGLRNDDTPRPRIKIIFDRFFVLAFTAVRLGIFFWIAELNGVANNPLFWLAYAGLAIVLIVHNTLHQIEFKFLTFLQLSLFRFSLPVFLVLLIQNQAAQILVTLITGLLLFTYPRFLTYLNAKGRLTIPERKESTFLLLSHFAALPLLIVVAAAAQSWAPLGVWLWVTGAQVGYVAVNRHTALGWLKIQLQSKD